MRVEVIRSPRRVRTAQARVVDGVVQVRVPHGLDAAEEERMVAGLVARVQRRRGGAAVDLEQRARRLARRYDLPQPASVVWSPTMRSRWGSCTVASGRVRVSARLAGMPDWVLDYVLVHELAHLAVPDHSAAFWAVVGRYPLAERARGFLIAVEHASG